MQQQSSLRVWFQQVSRCNWGHSTEWTMIHWLSPFTTPDLKFRSQLGSQITEPPSRSHTQSMRWRRWYFTRHQGHKDKHHFIHHSIQPALYVTAQNKNSSWKKSPACICEISCKRHPLKTLKGIYNLQLQIHDSAHSAL